MMEARINADEGRLPLLLAEVITKSDFPEYIVSLAMLAGQPDGNISVVHW